MVAEAAIRRRFRLIERHLDERLRRLVAAAEVAAAGAGGVSAVARATGGSRRAIRAGAKELKARGAGAPGPGGIPRRGGRPPWPGGEPGPREPGASARSRQIQHWSGTWSG